MAGDWIKMRTNLDTDPSVVRMASGLKTDRFAIVGRLHRIWAWANEHLTDGQNVPVDSAFLDKLVELSGFADAMRSVGWLSGRDGALCFPSFERHNGASAKARALDVERKRRVRQTSEKRPDTNRTESGPEKKREEKNRNTRRREFVPPVLEEVVDHWRQQNLNGSAEEFFLHYQANGWTQGSKSRPLVDWRAAAGKWSLRNPLFAETAHPAAASQRPPDPSHRPWKGRAVQSA